MDVDVSSAKKETIWLFRNAPTELETFTNIDCNPDG